MNFFLIHLLLKRIVKWKYRHSDRNFITGFHFDNFWCSHWRQFDNFLCSQWWKCHQPDSISFIHYDDVIMDTMASQITSLAIVYSTIYSGADQRKHQSSATLAFVRGIHRTTVNSRHKWPVTRKRVSIAGMPTVLYIQNAFCIWHIKSVFCMVILEICILLVLKICILQVFHAFSSRFTSLQSSKNWTKMMSAYVIWCFYWYYQL